MINLTTNFYWTTPSKGYTWRVGKWGRPGGQAEFSALLVEADVHNRSKKSYAPLRDKAALFRTFADLEPTPEGILQFANEYGVLGGATFFVDQTGSEEDQMYGRIGETREQWSEEIVRLKEAVTLLDLVRAGDEAGLSRLLRWREGPVEGPIKEFPDSWVYDRPAGSVMLTGSPADIFAPALGLLMGWTNERLRGHTQLALAQNDEGGNPVLQLELGSLLSALWVQLALAVANPADYRRCKSCGNWFVIPQDGRKADQVFCQDSCKSKDYRQRKVRAKQLAEEGIPLKSIAEELQTDMATLKKWTGRRR